jgi:hypothetical protein
MGNPAPPGLTNEKGRTAGAFGSLRIGYRFSTNWAVEFLGENTNHSIDACVSTGSGCGSATAKGSYQFTSTRLGPAVRLMTGGSKGRFVGSLGLGAAVHQIKYDDALKSKTTAPLRDDQTAAGSFLQLGGSYELNLGHFLLDAGIAFTVETADEQKVGIKNTGSGGIEFRVGYGAW